MGTKKIEQKAYIVAIDYEQTRGLVPSIALGLDRDKGSARFSCNVEHSDILAIKGAYDKRQEVKITIEFEQSDTDEARGLLALGDNKGAISKALDILERLDK